MRRNKIEEASKKLENVTLAVDTLDSSLKEVENTKIDNFVLNSDSNQTRLKFNDNDKALKFDGTEEVISAPKTIDRLEQISTANFERRKAEEAEEDDEDETLKIGDDISLELDDVLTL